MIAYLYEKEHVTILNTSAWEAKFPEGAVSSRGTTKTTDHGQVYYAKAEKKLG